MRTVRPGIFPNPCSWEICCGGRIKSLVGKPLVLNFVWARAAERENTICVWTPTFLISLLENYASGAVFSFSRRVCEDSLISTTWVTSTARIRFFRLRSEEQIVFFYFIDNFRRIDKDFIFNVWEAHPGSHPRNKNIQTDEMPTVSIARSDFFNRR